MPWVVRSQPSADPARPDVVRIATLWLEAPAGDPLLNHEVWEAIDDQILSVDKKAALQDNGFRIGQVTGLLPQPLRARITSGHDNNARLLQTRAEQVTRLRVDGILSDCEVEILRKGKRSTAHWQNAECSFVVLPSLTADGRVCLRFTPEIRHGLAAMVPEPFARSGWRYEREQPTESFGDLAWEMTLDPGDYALIGGRYDSPRSVGHQFFVRLTDAPPRQRMLIIHAARHPDTPDLGSNVGTTAASHDSPPLALRAAWSTVRGSAP